LIARLVTVGVVAGFIGGIAGWLISRPGEESFNRVDIGFLADMSTHHEGALRLSFGYFANESDAVVGHVAREIVIDQAAEISTMNGLLADAGDQADAIVGDDVAMEWMGEPVSPSDMPGLASSVDFERLEAAVGLAADDVFTELMIAHHAAGAQMASYAVAHGESEKVRRLAAGMARAQRLEITDLNNRRSVLGLATIDVEPAHDDRSAH